MSKYKVVGTINFLLGISYIGSTVYASDRGDKTFILFFIFAVINLLCVRKLLFSKDQSRLGVYFKIGLVSTAIVVVIAILLILLLTNLSGLYSNKI